MAVSVSLDTPVRTTLSATPNNCTEFELPKNARYVIMHFIADDGRIAFTGTDGAAQSAAYMTVPRNQIVQFSIPGALSSSGSGGSGGRNFAEKSIFLSSATASVVVEVIAMR